MDDVIKIVVLATAIIKFATAIVELKSTNQKRGN